MPMPTPLTRPCRPSSSTGASPTRAIAATCSRPTSPRDAFKDTGIGIASTSGTSKVGPMVITEDFGTQPNTRPSSWASSTRHRTTRGCTSSTGQANVQIDATNLATGQTTSVQTWAPAVTSSLWPLVVSGDRKPERHGHPDHSGEHRQRQRRARLPHHRPLGRPDPRAGPPALAPARGGTSAAPVCPSTTVAPVVSIPSAAAPVTLLPRSPSFPCPAALRLPLWAPGKPGTVSGS